MAESVLTIEAAAAGLSSLVDRLSSTGETAVIVKSGRPVARIIPVSSPSGTSDDLIEFLRRWREEHPESDESFADAIEQSRRSIQPPHDPWE